VGDVLADVHQARDRAKAAAGWVMDVYLLRAGSAPT
jgi:precorrin-6A synthase